MRYVFTCKDTASAERDQRHHSWLCKSFHNLRRESRTAAEVGCSRLPLDKTRPQVGNIRLADAHRSLNCMIDMCRADGYKDAAECLTDRRDAVPSTWPAPLRSM